ncbi:MAG: D-tyrosyl-tRNA(Tyr) deacylase [Chloroflexi bacterium]|nr:D-tyrosyl-tRNA(Tyr) deacylase [Chloroflexota bacterium]
MRALIQRVSSASVSVSGEVIGRINAGIVVFVGIHTQDGPAEAAWVADKIAHLRIFSDVDGKFNLSLLDTDGEVLLVSQFTLYGDARRGRRPSFTDAAAPQLAEPLVEQVGACLLQQGVKKVATGQFGAHMAVEIHNDGPVTIWLDSAVTRSGRVRLAAPDANSE